MIVLNHIGNNNGNSNKDENNCNNGNYDDDNDNGANDDNNIYNLEGLDLLVSSRRRVKSLFPSPIHEHHFMSLYYCIIHY